METPGRPPGHEASGTARDLYIALLAGCLTRELFLEEESRDVRLPADLRDAWLPILRQHGWRVVTRGGGADARSEGRDWPPHAETMIGRQRLDNLVACLTQVLGEDVPGDLIETGVWRGGSTILMRGMLAAWGVTDRVVWVADSFRGLPEPDPTRYPADQGIDLAGIPVLSVSRAQVEANFARYGLLDEQVRFLEGWFHETLPTAPIESLALIRLDGDLYSSTWEALDALYPKLSPGGYVIVDDYGGIEACRQAVTDYRRDHGVDDPIIEVDWTGVYWRRRG